jgi:glycosyltransferase involved in cell wall biosynthesis
MLHQRTNVEYLFFSDGAEKYWDKRHGVQLGEFHGSYLGGVRVFGTRIIPSLILRLLFTKFDLVIKCVGGRFALPATYIIAELRRKPFILWTNLWYHPATLFHRVSRPLTQWIYRHADAVVACGIHVERYLIDRGVDRDRIFLSQQAVNNSLFSVQPSPSEKDALRRELRAEKGKIVLYVGRYDRIKGLEYLVEGFATLTNINAMLVLVGEGRERSRIASMVHEKGLGEKVIFRNYVPNHQLPLYYAVANVLVLPSITIRDVKEVWGLVINEAMNQGCPVIATSAVGAVAGGLVQDGRTGYVVPERNAGAITQSLERILTNDAIEKEMRAAALEEIAKWTYDRQVQGFVDAIRFVNRGRIRV